MFHAIFVNYLTNIQGGAGAGPKWQLRLQPNTPAPKPCFKLDLDRVLKVLRFYREKPTTPLICQLSQGCFDLSATTRAGSQNQSRSRLDWLHNAAWSGMCPPHSQAWSGSTHHIHKPGAESVYPTQNPRAEVATTFTNLNRRVPTALTNWPRFTLLFSQSEKQNNVKWSF